ncbi:MAG: tRNA (N(6)-L-threonylcarbamoyladenosine(37)-C(2))-methylthiotransferase MtaB [Candidatus Omnitrophica bacterium]|nr:tRNA (N(6)-L-threonylcarbamoyladenosine(37)-C(2))-methylthiotransferase MtaB [Candidatus Omnitrophota bacterium]
MKVKFFTLGCKVNQYETQGLKEKFQAFGFYPVEKKADLYVINTCSVTKKADNKSKEAILKAKKENPRAKIAVCGCLVQYNKSFIEKLDVDYIVSQDKKHFLPEIITQVVDVKDPNLKLKDNWSLKISSFSNQRAFVKIQDGCDNFCSYCKIPYLRGQSRSRDFTAVVDECKRLCLKHKEIILTGINLSLYGKDLSPARNLKSLVREILSIPQLGRLRLSSLEPNASNKELFGFLKHNRFCPHFHFPFQYGDDQILADMNKEERVNLYEDLVYSARRINPDVAISCDIMIGYPGETVKTFENTLSFLKKIKPMRMHIFTFSPREQTKFHGFKLKNQALTKKRLLILKDLAAKLSLEYAEKFINKSLALISEKKTNAYISGYTENYLKVFIKDKVPIGDFLPVKINKIIMGKIFASKVKR